MKKTSVTDHQLPYHRVQTTASTDAGSLTKGFSNLPVRLLNRLAPQEPAQRQKMVLDFVDIVSSQDQAAKVMFQEISCKSNTENQFVMYNSFKKQNREDYLSYISPQNAFKNNVDIKGLTWHQNTRNISTSKTQQRYKPEKMADYRMERKGSRPVNTVASDQTRGGAFDTRLKSITIASSYDEGPIPAAIRAISRGSVNKRSLNANMGRSYYEKFIRTHENDRLKQFIQEGSDPLMRGFIPLSVKDLDNPLKALGQQKKSVQSTQVPKPLATIESGNLSPTKKQSTNLQNRYQRSPKVTQNIQIQGEVMTPSQDNNMQTIDAKAKTKFPIRSKVSDIMQIKNQLSHYIQPGQSEQQSEDLLKTLSDSKSPMNQVGFVVVETTSNSDHTKASGNANRLPQMRKQVKQKSSKSKNYEANQVIMEEDYEQRIMNALRNFKPWKQNSDESLKEICASQFKHICEFNGEAHEVNMKIENLKLQKSGLKRYLETKYEKRLAQKIIVLFEWAQKQIKHDMYFRNILDMLLKPSEDYSEHLRTLKLLTFNLYDMNNDQQIDNNDLFSLLKCQQDEKYIKDGAIRDNFFRDVLYRDIMDIQASLRVKQEELQMNDPVYHLKPGQNPRIKNLECFLGVAKIKREVSLMRRENKETFIQVFKEQPVADNSNLIRNVLEKSNAFHNAEDGKKGFQKQWNFEKRQAGLDPAKISQKVQLSIQKMTQEGEGVKPNDRRNSVGLFIQQTDKIYGTKDFNWKLTFDEFESKVKFTYGVPLVILDILDTLLGSSFLKDHYAQVNPKKLIERFNPQDDAFSEAKLNIDEDFIPNTWAIFNALGEVDFNVEMPSLMQEERETRQYISQESLKKNLWKVFGIRNDFFGQMLFSFLSERAAPNYGVNYLQFLKKMMPVWPRKQFDGRQETDRERDLRLKKENKERKYAIHKLIFELQCLQGKDDITLVDLIQLCVHFKEEDPFGKEVHKLLKLLIDRNVKPRFVRSEFKLTYKNYVEVVSQQALHHDIVFAFFDQMKKLEAKESKEQLKKDDRDKEKVILITMPVCDWKANSIQDETGRDKDYFEGLKELEKEYKIEETLDLHKDLRSMFK